MKLGKTLVIGIFSALALAACSQSKEAATVTVHDEMVKTVIPQTQVIWDVSNQTFDDNGEPDPKKMTDADWVKVKSAAGQLMISLDRMATATKITAAKPGDKILDQEYSGSPKAQDVQAKIDADPNGFRQHAKQMKDFFAVIDQAADTKNFQAFYAKANEADSACEGCHKSYWLKPAK
jgi:hypothetical protein